MFQVNQVLKNKFSKLLRIDFFKINLVRNAGRPITNTNVNLCSGSDKITLSNSAIVLESPNYPNYPSQITKCKRDIESAPGTNMRVYMTNGGLRSGNLK